MGVMMYLWLVDGVGVAGLGGGLRKWLVREGMREGDVDGWMGGYVLEAQGDAVRCVHVCSCSCLLWECHTWCLRQEG